MGCVAFKHHFPPFSFGYAEFATHKLAKAAINGLNGEELDNRCVKLDFAEKRNNDGGGGGGGGGRGSRGTPRGGRGTPRGGRGGELGVLSMEVPKLSFLYLLSWFTCVEMDTP